MSIESTMSAWQSMHFPAKSKSTHSLAQGNNRVFTTISLNHMSAGIASALEQTLSHNFHLRDPFQSGNRVWPGAMPGNVQLWQGYDYYYSCSTASSTFATFAAFRQLLAQRRLS